MQGTHPSLDTQPTRPAPSSGTTVSGQRLIFWLFIILAGCTAAALWIFTRTEVGHLYRRRVYFALAGDLAAPVVAWFILKAIGRRRARKALAEAAAQLPSPP